MMPTCMEPRCKAVATKQVAGIINEEDTERAGQSIFDPLYFCDKHAEKFLKKYGVVHD